MKAVLTSNCPYLRKYCRQLAVLEFQLRRPYNKNVLTPSVLTSGNGCVLSHVQRLGLNVPTHFLPVSLKTKLMLFFLFV